LLEYGLFDLPESANLLPHRHLGVAIDLQHRLGNVAEKVILAVAMRDTWKLCGDPRHECVLPVRHPKELP